MKEKEMEFIPFLSNLFYVFCRYWKLLYRHLTSLDEMSETYKEETEHYIWPFLQGWRKTLVRNIFMLEVKNFIFFYAL